MIYLFILGLVEYIYVVTSMYGQGIVNHPCVQMSLDQLILHHDRHVQGQIASQYKCVNSKSTSG